MGPHVYSTEKYREDSQAILSVGPNTSLNVPPCVQSYTKTMSSISSEMMQVGPLKSMSSHEAPTNAWRLVVRIYQFQDVWHALCDIYIPHSADP